MSSILRVVAHEPACTHVETQTCLRGVLSDFLSRDPSARLREPPAATISYPLHPKSICLTKIVFAAILVPLPPIRGLVDHRIVLIIFLKTVPSVRYDYLVWYNHRRQDHVKF